MTEPSTMDTEESSLHIAFVVADNGGLMFNHRRVSKDSKLKEALFGIVRASSGQLWVKPYSLALFDGATVRVADEPWNEAGHKDVVFIEDADPAIIPGVTKVTLFRWNRKYPSDLKSTFDFSGYDLVATNDFPGSSHARITKETWVKRQRG